MLLLPKQALSWIIISFTGPSPTGFRTVAFIAFDFLWQELLPPWAFLCWTAGADCGRGEGLVVKKKISSTSWQGTPVTGQHISSTSARHSETPLPNYKHFRTPLSSWMLFGPSLVLKDLTKWGQKKILLLQIKAYRRHFNHWKPFPLQNPCSNSACQ